jgi:chemotaxis protein histidine kinase CheA
MTHEGLDDIVAICSFVLDPDDLKIFEAPPLTPEQRAIEAAERARIEDEQGYGFFDPNDAGDGAQPELSDDERGYGFFQPIEQIRREAGIVAESAPVQAVASSRPEPLEVSEVAAEKKAVKKAADAAHAQAESSSIRVSIEKVDQLINLVGELVITQAMIEQRSDGLDPMVHQRLLASVSQLTRNTRDLQEAVMSIRMMPMDFVFSRFPRMVRDLAVEAGQEGRLHHQRRGDGTGQGPDRTHRRSADAPGAQLDRPRHRDAGRAYRRRQIGIGPPVPVRGPPGRQHRDRSGRRRRRPESRADPGQGPAERPAGVRAT